MDIKVAAAAALAIVVGLGVEGGMHYRHQFHASNQPKLVMMEASNADFPMVAFNTDWQSEAEQLAGQRECVRKSLESAHSEMRQSLHEQMSSAKEERQLALAHARAISDQARSEMRESIRDQVREQQQALRDQLRQQREQVREQQQRMRDQLSNSADLD